jgi:cytoplasmic iron level regulating protein YaaA (DUF328/UPF0246 family)
MAKLMYRGIYFKTCLELAKKLVPEKDIYILSAQYGLLFLTQKIKPYEKTLKRMSKQERKKWRQEVKMQLRKHKLMDSHIFFVCSSLYYQDLKGIPLLPKMGMGLQLKWMRDKIKELENVYTKKGNGSCRGTLLKSFI